jgi:septal ring factor EnvC (AmiA/AmiB activator)
MKKIILLCFLGLAISVQAQDLSRAEKKALKKEIKAYKKNPASYKSIKVKNKTTIEQQEAVIEDLSKQLESLRLEQNDLRDSIKALAARYAELKMLEETRDQVPMGTIYQVQLGLYERLDLKSFNREGLMVKAEETDAGKRYIIGFFKNVDDAKRFNKDVQKLGVKDAFVSKYEDGVRDMKFDANKVK